MTPPPAGTGRSDQLTVAGSSVFGTACSAPSLALGTTLVIVLTRAHASRAAGLLSSYHSTSSPLPLACKHRAGDELCAFREDFRAVMRCRYALPSLGFPWLLEPGSLVGAALVDVSARRRCLTEAPAVFWTDR